PRPLRSRNFPPRASPWRAFRTVTLVELAPAITSGAAIVFLFCSTSFGIVQTLGAPGYGTLETEIWVQTTTFLDLRAAAVLSLLQVVIVGIATAAGPTGKPARKPAAPRASGQEQQRSVPLSKNSGAHRKPRPPRIRKNR
ncbi:hypothetical protein R6G99_07490, partial [Actinotignum timonense]|nr:hypothetical protein [Actinotignum timonense]